MKREALISFILIVQLMLLSGCTRNAGTLVDQYGANINIAAPANLGSNSVYGIAWCTAPDIVCQKSLRTTELKPGMMPGGGGYSVFPDNKIQIPKYIEVSWYDSNGAKNIQVVELNIPGRAEVIQRYGATRSTWNRSWDIVLTYASPSDEQIETVVFWQTTARRLR
ncbi:MAG: hypothetical protein AB2598_19935 [Candidatus Thiodiazotropha sp.]